VDYSVELVIVVYVEDWSLKTQEIWLCDERIGSRFDANGRGI